MYPSTTESLHPFERAFAESWLQRDWQDVGVLAAVSGGADSVAMLRAMHRLHLLNSRKAPLMIAFFHHGLRKEADQDELWITELANKLNLPIICGHADGTKITEASDGIEAAARYARMDFLQESAESTGARFVVTAHTKNDQAETVLFRILRGTGISGLAGIPRTRTLSNSVTLLRPLLHAQRAEVLGYLNDLNQDWREDATNQSLEFTRNRIRNDLLPALKKDFNSCVDESLVRLSKQAASYHEVIKRDAAELLDLCVTFESDNIQKITSVKSICIDTNAIQGVPEIIVAELFRSAWRSAKWPEQAMSEEHWEWLVQLAVSGESLPARILPGSVRAERNANEILLATKMPEC